jgi:hypothetical protein
MASTQWDVRRKRFFAGGLIYYIGFCGIFGEFDRSKSWQNWWQKKDAGRTCIEPKPYASRFMKKYELNIISVDETFTMEDLKKRKEIRREKRAEKEALAEANK